MFTDMVLKAIFMYRIANTFVGKEVFPVIIGIWQEQLIKSWSSYVTGCGW
jgi:hypothetical protein